MRLPSLILAPLALLAATGAVAQQQSAFGCRALQHEASVPVLEGADGIFFRRDIDLRMYHPMSSETVDLVGRLSEALAARGTVLIYVPVPTKSLSLPEALPAHAADYGFDPGIAAEVYDDIVARLRAEGVTTVDGRAALTGAQADEPVFIPTDFHWSSSGARAVAEVTAEAIRETDIYDGLEKTAHETVSQGVEPVFSEIRRQIQARCRETVPPAQTEVFETGTTGDAAGGGLFAGDAGGPAIALVGTSMSRTEEFNFDGFLAQASGLEVANYAIRGGNQYGSILSYMMSDDFAERPPDYLVWENPVYNNLGEFGELPLLELIAAATDACTLLEDTRPGPQTMAAEVPEGLLGRDDYLRADAGSTRGGRAVEMTFVTEAGLEVTAKIERAQRLDPTRRFYQYLGPYWEDGIATVVAEFDRAIPEDATLAICKQEDDRS
ncbi:alginate O-acetyltransferase AlgX-related protein [Histidinibacterium lentulum]|uniref:AlgX/AlgJ SGNH hydrolase-like domain-containing protein n=1 Tax=Histidinibacterium lentulum TaxID=2480588 RepID=A0A3N2R842_9RHOB|nr:hypothetical protein [Histidinibacterium lentulum]ROU03624.1 hypothetical protein EAT49_04830 [Histidinibacterium lentulum]